MGVGDDNAVKRHFVAGVVDDFPGHRCPAGQCNARQVVREEIGAAGNVDPGQLGTVAVFVIVATTQVAHVVEQTDDQTRRGALGPQLLRRRGGEIMSRQQPRQGEGHIQRVLTVVIDGIYTVIIGHFSGEKALKMLECAANGVEWEIFPSGATDLFHGFTNRSHRTHLHGARYVEVVQPRPVHGAPAD